MTETAADEQDLAKALDSVADAANSLDGSSSVKSSDDSHSDGANGIELPPIVPPNSPVAPSGASDSPAFPSITPVHDSNDPVQPTNDAPLPFSPVPHLTDEPSDDDSSKPTVDPVVTGPLADIKKEALGELRPLVDKLNVSPEEKFDTYLLLIRSTDDTSLIGPAHEAAKSISDEAKRAEALLDIIKEIDYLSRQGKSVGN
jgi:hypothetical protein